MLFSLADCASATLRRDRHQVRGLFQVSSLNFVGSSSLAGFGLLFSVELHELGQIELGLLEHLSLVDEDVLEGEDFVALIGDLLGDDIGEARRKI